MSILEISPDLITIELFGDRFYSMLVEAIRSTGLWSICILEGRHAHPW